MYFWSVEISLDFFRKKCLLVESVVLVFIIYFANLLFRRDMRHFLFPFYNLRINLETTKYFFLRGLEPLSLCDWPGHTTLVLFMADCDFRCPTCHNSAMAWKFDSLPVLDKSRVFDFIAERQNWLDGLVITGGEPTLHEEIFGLVEDLQQFYLPIKMDSNGQRPHIVRELLSAGLVNTFAVDVKGPWEKYSQLSGGKVDAFNAQKNLTEIFSLTKEFPRQLYFRCTQVPILSDEDIATVRSYLPQDYELIVQKYIPPIQTHKE